MVKLLKPIKYTLPQQVALLSVKLGDNLRMAAQEYTLLLIVAKMNTWIRNVIFLYVLKGNLKLYRVFFMIFMMLTLKLSITFNFYLWC